MTIDLWTVFSHYVAWKSHSL